MRQLLVREAGEEGDRGEDVAIAPDCQRVLAKDVTEEHLAPSRREAPAVGQLLHDTARHREASRERPPRLENAVRAPHGRPDVVDVLERLREDEAVERGSGTVSAAARSRDERGERVAGCRCRGHPSASTPPPKRSL